ncbi:MAG: co-chaperone GroES [bacterium]
MSKKQQFKVTDFKPQFDLILVRPMRQEERGEFTVPQQYEDKVEIGKILDFGRGKPLENGQWIECPFKKDDIVIFNKYSATKVDIGEELFVRLEDILGVLKK